MDIQARAMKDLKAFFRPNQIEEAIDSCDNLRDKVLIRLLWRTGCRISEIVKPGKDRPPVLGLRTADILWEDSALIIRHAKRKGNPPRRVLVDRETLAMVREYLDKRPEKSEFVIPITRQMAYLVVRQAFERIGIKTVGDPLVSKRRHPSPHKLRHSLAVHSVRSTKGNYADLIKLQHHLGHASIATTAGYVQFADEEQEAWYNGLWKPKQAPLPMEKPEKAKV